MNEVSVVDTDEPTSLIGLTGLNDHQPQGRTLIHTHTIDRPPGDTVLSGAEIGPLCSAAPEQHTIRLSGLMS